MMEQDIEKLITDAKDAQRYEKIQSDIKEVAKSMRFYKWICGLNLAVACGQCNDCCRRIHDVQGKGHDTIY